MAAAALDAGAALVNDVSGGLADEAMAGVVAALGVPFVAMHWRGTASTWPPGRSTTTSSPRSSRELGARLDALATAGVDLDRVVLDPGLGFAKEPRHNWALLAGLEALHALGRPLLVGASRKGFLGTLLAGDDGSPRPASDRDDATAALSALVAERGVWGVRVHAVRPTVDALRVGEALRSARLGT